MKYFNRLRSHIWWCSILFSFGLWLSLCPSALPAEIRIATVEDAFQHIHVNRVVFKSNLSVMITQEKDFLEKLFQLVDFAVLERVKIMTKLQAYKNVDENIYSFNTTEALIQQLEVPDRLKAIHQLVMQGIKEQQQFINTWRQEVKAGRQVDIASHPLVQSSSQKLRTAYQDLLDLYPEENKHNRSAFYSYLCALDFT